MDDYELSTEVMFETPDPIQSPVPVELYSEIALSLALEGDMDAVALEAFLAKHDLTLQQYNTLVSKQTFLRYLNEAKVLVSEQAISRDLKYVHAFMQSGWLTLCIAWPITLQRSRRYA